MVVCEEKKGGMDGPVWLMGLTLKGRQMPNCVCVCVCGRTVSRANKAESTTDPLTES